MADTDKRNVHDGIGYMPRSSLIPMRNVNGEFYRDIQEFMLRYVAPEILDTLLIDRSATAADKSGKIHNIRWCTDMYGADFSPDEEISAEAISQLGSKIICPRVDKRLEEQRKRSVDKAEVFTPCWVCNKQNNLVDKAWFDNQIKLFNFEKEDNTWDSTWLDGKKASECSIKFPKGKSWMEYVAANRLEVSCGEAPYLTSRYDTTTGKVIPVRDRIGLLDRKLRIVSQQCDLNPRVWVDCAKVALRSCYGFEWQGDNVFLARENMLYAVLETFRICFPGRYIPYEDQLEFAEIISWNIWQMDGLKFVLPNTCHDEVILDDHLPGFDPTEVKTRECPGCKTGDKTKHNGTRCLIMDWIEGKQIYFGE